MQGGSPWHSRRHNLFAIDSRGTFRESAAMPDSLPGVDPLPVVIARIEAAMRAGVEHPPAGEFGYCLVHVADLRRLITETERAVGGKMDNSGPSRPMASHPQGRPRGGGKGR
jgi:hypothetical protein